MKRVKERAQKTVTQAEKSHASDMARLESKRFKQEREASKAAVCLQSEVESEKVAATKELLSVKKENQIQLEHQQYLSSLELKHQQDKHSNELRHVKSDVFKEQRAMSKSIVELEGERASAIAEKEAALAEKDSAVRDAVKGALQDERAHHSRVLQEERKKQKALSERVKEHAALITTLMERSHAAERRRDQSARDADQSARRSGDLNTIISFYEKDLKESRHEADCLRGALYELNDLMQESTKRIEELEESMPITEIKRVRTGKGGNSSWQPFMWDLIMEALINGTPPSAIRANIQLHIETFAPFIDTVELPSLWTIRRARTVILVICQTLAAYRLAKADKWGQLFTDATSRRQVTFQNLLISIEDDELYR